MQQRCTWEVLPEPDYGVCGFSPVHGDKIAVLEYYLDESGSHSDHFLVVGGFVADVNKWADFSREWREILDRHQLKYFHMKDFMNGRSRAFRHLSRREKRDLLGLLIATIKRTALFSVCCLAKPYQYEQITNPEFRRTFGTCYSFSVRMCLIAVDRLLTDPNRGTETLGVFIEDGHQNCAEAIAHIGEHKAEIEPVPRSFIVDSGLLPQSDNYNPDDPYRERGLKIGAYGAGSKMTMPPLQAADILVYSAYSDTPRGEAVCTNVWKNIGEQVPPYVVPLTERRLSSYVEGASDFAEKNKEKRRITGQFIREANRFGLRGEVIPHKGVDLFGKHKDVKRFMKWASKKNSG